MNDIARQPAEILLIDDQEPARAAATAVLDDAGYTVRQARDRSAALKIARTEAIDLVICDVHLGGDSGLELCREVRRLPGMQDVPFMFVSSTQLPDIVRRSHEAGGAYYLRKPLDPDVLLDLVSKALWLPHLLHSRLARREPPLRTVPPPRNRPSVKVAAVQGIRMPLA